MENEIIPYLEMCQREGLSLQRGMNFRINWEYSIILMSQRTNAPYKDHVEGDGSVLIYEGHDVPRSKLIPDPKIVDQERYLPNGNLTENGKFHKAAQEYINHLRDPEKVKVYEKIHSGIWSYNGFFNLVNSWTESDGRRKVFKYQLVVVGEIDISKANSKDLDHRRIIPTAVKLEVWKRDGGKCVVCGSKTELHFDHIIPYSKGGTSITAANIQLLCARHNLEKSDRIE
ncbi:MAG: HNH endonuclease [Chloroflexi bacterium]|nr:HNH endonuclease [Chloroflexota bacterium]